MSARYQTPENRRRQTSNAMSSVSRPVFDGSNSSGSSIEHSPQAQISRRTTNHPTSMIKDEPIGTHSLNRKSSWTSTDCLSIAHHVFSEKIEPDHSSRITHPKRVPRISGDRHNKDSKAPFTGGLVQSSPKYELVFSRTPQTTERHHNRGAASTNVSASIPRIPSKPFVCPKAHCSRAFSDESALKYHSKHGYCNSLDLSQIYVSSSFASAKPKYRSDEYGMTTVTASPTDISPNMFPRKIIGGIPVLASRREKKGKQSGNLVFNQVSRHIGRVNPQSTIERGRGKHTSHRSTSLPNYPQPNATLPSWLTAFPPPPPFGSRKNFQEQRDRSDHVFLECHVTRRKEVHKSHSSEWRTRESGQHAFGSSHLSRSLSTSRPSERDPVLGRPYSQFPSRPSSVRTSSGTPSSTQTSFSSSYLRFPTQSFHPSPSSIKPIKNATSSRLAHPLPLPPHTRHTNVLRAAREQEWGTVEGRDPGFSNKQASLSPRTPSPQISFRHFTRPPSPRPSSFSSSIPSFSRQSSRSSQSHSSPGPSLKYSPSSSPKVSSLSPSYVRSMNPLLDPTSSPRPIQRLSIRPLQRERPLSWREKVRQGFWNRRGDFLTEDGFIVYAPPDRAFPDDLATYPAETEGYQDHELEFKCYMPRPELPESLPRRGRPPQRPYDSFIVYVYK